MVMKEALTQINLNLLVDQPTDVRVEVVRSKIRRYYN